MSDDKLSQELEAYRKLAKEDKNIDVAGLMIQALGKQQANVLPDKQKRWAFLISLAVPPVGLLFAAKFYMSGKDDGKQAAYICIALTAVSIIIAWLFFKALVSSSGISVDQIQQIKPQDIKDIYQ